MTSEISQNPLYTPWDSLPYVTGLGQIQSIISYCASRFRKSATAFQEEDNEKKDLFLGYFRAELVSTLSIPL
jgi:hypothetical protein